MKKLALLITIVLLFTCSSNQDKAYTLSINEIPSGIEIKQSGKRLINKPFGLIQLINDQINNDSTLIIAVHGYKSEGYEWVHFLNQFSKHYSNLYFYRYDWNNCPDEIGVELARTIDSLLNKHNDISNVEIFGHSFGGLVITYAAADIESGKEIRINTIASPLAGYPRIMDDCDLQYTDENELQYANWNSNISHHQWRTQKEQDGAFRDMSYDPQDILINNSTVTELPDSMDGHRLGHNWSVSWVTDYLLNNE